MRQITTNWSGPQGGGLTVMNFADAVPVAAQRAALGAFWADWAEYLASPYTSTVDVEGREVNPATGLTTDFWTEGTPYAAAGGAGSNPVADATQVLIRWRTPDVVAGRRVQGRTFVPGLASTGLAGGGINAGAVAAFNAIAQGLVDADVGLGVWSRPTDARAGTFNEVTSGSVWNELAVQRGRRG